MPTMRGDRRLQKRARGNKGKNGSTHEAIRCIKREAEHYFGRGSYLLITM